MLSIIIPARNNYDYTHNCIVSVLSSLDAVHEEVELLLIDDSSEPSSRIIECFEKFRNNGKAKCRIFRFYRWQHYTGVFALGLQESRGSRIMFLSNDMLMTPYFMDALLQVSQAVPEAGIVRGTSQYCDSHPEHQLASPLPIRDYRDVVLFSAFVNEYYGTTWTEDRMLSGDAVLLRRELLDAIGNMDTRFFGYFGDYDYGLRVRRAGFKLVCAKGAWLHHYGAGHIVSEAKDQEEVQKRKQERFNLVGCAYQQFRAKWEKALTPEQYRNVNNIDHEALINAPMSWDNKIELQQFTATDFQEL